MAHPNADLVRKGFEAFATGDMAAMDQMMVDDAKWHVPGTGVLSGDFEGKEAIFGYFGRIAQEADVFEQQLHAVVADDEHAVALVKTTASRGDKELRYDAVFVFHVDAGKLTETWFTPMEHAEVEAFWA
jgi:hypothetical protein